MKKALTPEQAESNRRRAREWARRNRDKVRERARQRAKDPAVREYQCQYRKATAEKRAEYNKQYRAAHPERIREYAARHRAKHAEAIRIRNRHANWRVKGLPEPTRPQPANCELCDRLLQPGKIHLDHCHETGVFRGWLCNRCNLALGHFEDSIAGLERAIAYLRRCG